MIDGFKKVKKEPLSKSLKGKSLKKIIEQEISKKNFVVSMGFNGRKIFLDKFIDANFNYKRGKERLRYFFCALVLISTIRKDDKCVFPYKKNGNKNWEILGKTLNNRIFKVHIREDLKNKDRILRFISCFPAK